MYSRVTRRKLLGKKSNPAPLARGMCRFARSVHFAIHLTSVVAPQKSTVCYLINSETVDAHRSYNWLFAMSSLVDHSVAMIPRADGGRQRGRDERPTALKNESAAIQYPPGHPAVPHTHSA